MSFCIGFLKSSKTEHNPFLFKNRKYKAKTAQIKRFMFIGTQCDLWGRPDGTGHEKISRGNFPRLILYSDPKFICATMFRSNISCGAGSPHGLPRMPPDPNIWIGTLSGHYQNTLLDAHKSKSSMLCVSTSAYESKNAAI